MRQGYEENTRGRNGYGKKGSYILSGRVKKRRRRRIIVNTVLGVVLALSLITVTAMGAVWHTAGGLRKSDLSDASDLGIYIDPNLHLNDDIRNIALFGVDSRDSDSTVGHSDVTMIVSINAKENTVRTVSILRDSYVPIAGHGSNRINFAYFTGGPVLAINTLNKLFRLNITDYVTVNFSMVTDIIDLLGGVDIEITEDERQQINWLIDTEDFKSSYKSEYVKKSGLVHLNGKQAMHYSRIRYIDSDAFRVQRQTKVMSLLLEKVKNLSITKYPELLRKILKNVETSLGYSDLLSYAPMVLKLGGIRSTSVPDATLDKNVRGGNYNGMWVYRYDLDAAADRIHEFLYGDDYAYESGSLNGN